MTLQEAKDEAAHIAGYVSWQDYADNAACPRAHIEFARFQEMCDTYTDIYARAKWDEALEAERKSIVDESYNTEFKP